MEGKAPSAEIQGAFFRFRKWLMAVYRHIRNLRVELNDEVREVFGRMIAAEHETGMAAAEYGLLGLTPDEMKALGMTRTQQDYARKLTEAALDVAATKLAQARNRERRQRKKEYQETAAEELAMKPVYMARDAMLETPLDAELVATLYGESTLEALQETHRGGVQAGTGVDPEIFAASQGFESRAKMISELLDVPQKSVAIRQRAEAMEQQYAASFSATDYLLESKQLREQAALVETYLSRQLGRQRVQQGGPGRCCAAGTGEYASWEGHAGKKLSGGGQAGNTGGTAGNKQGRFCHRPGSEYQGQAESGICQAEQRHHFPL